MSQLYPKFKESLLRWALGDGTHGAAKFCLALADESFSYDPSDSQLDDLNGVWLSGHEIEGASITNGLLFAPTSQIEGVTIGQTLGAIVVYVAWDSGNHLVGYFDQASFPSLPTTVPAENVNIEWSSQGIFQL